jgi:hypothetical protein
MSTTADSVVVDLIANVDKASANVTGYARTFDSSMTSVERSAAKGDAAVKRSGDVVSINSARSANATRNLGRQISDIGTQLAGGQSPFLILAQQAPQVADALADTGGKAARVAAFFAGPWGAALLAAGSIAGVLAGKMLETGDAAAKAQPELDRYVAAMTRLANIDPGALKDQNRLAQINGNLDLIARGINPETGDKQKFKRGSGLGSLKREYEAEADAIRVRLNLDKLSAKATKDAADAEEARRKAESKADSDRTKADADAKRRQEELKSNVVKLQAAFDPLAASAREYYDVLKDISDLKSAGLIDATTAAAYSSGADIARRAAAMKAEGLNQPSADEILKRPGGIQDTVGASDRRIDQSLDSEDEAERRKLQTQQRVFQQQEKDVVRLADLFENAFVGGSGSIWKTFEREGLKTLALLLARFAVLQFAKGGGGVGNILGNLGKAFSATLGRASGGYVPGGQMIRVNEGASPGKVEGFVPTGSGNVIPLGRMQAAQGGGGTTVVQHISVDARNSVNPDGFAEQILNRSAQQAALAGQTAFSAGQQVQKAAARPRMPGSLG